MSMINRIGLCIVAFVGASFISSMFKEKPDRDEEQRRAMESIARDTAQMTNQMWAQAQGKVQAESYAAQQQNAYWAAYQAQAQAGMKELLAPVPTPQRQERVTYRANPYTGGVYGSDGTRVSRNADGSVSVTTGGVKTSTSHMQ